MNYSVEVDPQVLALLLAAGLPKTLRDALVAHLRTQLGQNQGASLQAPVPPNTYHTLDFILLPPTLGEWPTYHTIFAVDVDQQAQVFHVLDVVVTASGGASG